MSLSYHERQRTEQAVLRALACAQLAILEGNVPGALFWGALSMHRIAQLANDRDVETAITCVRGVKVR